MSTAIWIVGALVILLVIACVMLGGSFLWDAIYDEIYQWRSRKQLELDEARKAGLK